MQAVERKSQMAKHDSARIIDLMAVIGVFCLILAFGYFWYFPFYISNSIAYLSDRMKALLKKSGIVLDIKTNDESFIILQGINLLENKLDAKEDDGALENPGLIFPAASGPTAGGLNPAREFSAA